MNKKCLFCTISISLNRKYCSSKCVKKAWYLRRNPNCYYAKDNSKFWESETGMGFKWEQYAAKVLGAEHLKFNHGRADLLWNGKYVDVKVANRYRRKNKRGKPVVREQEGVWSFKFGKCETDFFFFICLKENNEIEKMLFIPRSEIPGKAGSVIGTKSKYDKFIYKTT